MRSKMDLNQLESVAGGYAVVHVDPNNVITSIEGTDYSKGSAQQNEISRFDSSYKEGKGYISIELEN